MKSITDPEMCRLSEAHGWLLRRINGSHQIYSNSGERKVISIPVHGSKNLKPELAVRIVRDAGVST